VQDVKKEEGLKLLAPGEIVYVVMSRCCSDEPRRLVAPPSGALSPRTDRCTDTSASTTPSGRRRRWRRLRGGPGGGDAGVDARRGVRRDRSWDEKREVWKISGKIYRSFNITQSAIVKDEYTTVLAAAVLVS